MDGRPAKFSIDIKMTMQDPNSYKLLTPGPLTTSLSVRSEMLIDRCTWDKDYKDMTQEVRS